MARVRTRFGPAARAGASFGLAAAALLGIAPVASATDAAPVAADVTISLRALASRPILLGAAARFLALETVFQSLAPRSLPAAPPLAYPSPPSPRPEASSVAARATVVVDSGARVGCRFGDVIPYFRFGARPFLPRDPTDRGDGLLRALGVRVDLDARTSLQFEASLGEPDLAGLGRRDREGEGGALGFAIRLAFSF